MTKQFIPKTPPFQRGTKTVRTQLRQYVGEENNRENDRRPPMSDSLRGFLWGVACLVPVPHRTPPPCVVIMGLVPLLIEIQRHSVGLRYNAVESRVRRKHCGQQAGLWPQVLFWQDTYDGKQVCEHTH